MENEKYSGSPNIGTSKIIEELKYLKTELNDINVQINVKTNDKQFKDTRKKFQDLKEETKEPIVQEVVVKNQNDQKGIEERIKAKEREIATIEKQKKELEELERYLTRENGAAKKFALGLDPKDDDGKKYEKYIQKLQRFVDLGGDINKIKYTGKYVDVGEEKVDGVIKKVKKTTELSATLKEAIEGLNEEEIVIKMPKEPEKAIIDYTKRLAEAKAELQELQDEQREFQKSANAQQNQPNNLKNNNIRKTIRKWNTRNQKDDDIKAEQFMIGNDETGYARDINKNKEIGAVTYEVYEETIKGAQKKFNSAFHSHPNELTAAFSFDDIEAAIKQRVDGIIHQYVISLRDIAMLDVSQFDDSQLQEIADYIKSNAFAKNDQIKDYIVDTEKVYDDISGNIEEHIRNLLESFNKSFDLSDKHIDIAQLASDIEEQLKEESITDIEDFGAIIVENIEGALQGVGINVNDVTFKKIQDMSDQYINEMMQRFIENTLIAAIEEITPNLELGSVYKKTKLDDYLKTMSFNSPESDTKSQGQEKESTAGSENSSARKKINKDLLTSKEYVEELKKAYIELSDAMNDMQENEKGSSIYKVAEKDIEDILSNFPELEKFKEAFIDASNARPFVISDEWNEFLSTLPKAHEYLETIGYDFQKMATQEESASLSEYAKQAKKEIQDTRQLIESLKSDVSRMDPDGIISKYLLGKDGVKGKEQLVNEIQNEVKTINDRLQKEYLNGVKDHDYEKEFAEPFEKLRISQAFGQIKYTDKILPYYIQDIYDRWFKKTPGNFDNLDDDQMSFWGAMIDAQERLNILQQNGGKDYEAHLERIKQLTEQVQAAMEKNASFEKTNIDDTSISQEEATERAEGILKEKEAIDQLIASVIKYKAESKQFADVDSWFSNYLPDTSKLQNISNMLEEEADNLKIIDILRNRKQNHIYNDAVDYKFKGNHGAPKELEKYWEELDDTFYPRQGLAQFSGEEAIEKLNQKAKELGVTFDETAKKWVQLSSSISGESSISSGNVPPKRVAYHYGNISSGKPSHQFGDEISAWFTGQRNGGRAWADGTGTYVTSDASQYNKGDFSDPLKRFYAIDTSNLKLFEAHTEETAEQYYNFIHQLEQFCIKAGSGFDGFDTNLQNIDANSLYQTFQKVFPDIKLTFDKFNSFISDMTALVQESGLKADGSQNARQMFDFKKKNGADDIKTRFMKMLGFQGTDLSGTSFDTLRDGSVLFDTSNVKDNIIKTGQTIQDVMTQTQNSIRETSIPSQSPISSEETHIDTLHDGLMKLRDLKKELLAIDLGSDDGIDQGYNLMYQIQELENKLHELYSYNKDHHIIDAESTIDDISRIENKLMHGTILTMFRGTDNPDNPILSKGEHGGGTFFTDDIDSAKYYGENGKLYQAKLMIKDALEFIPDVNSMVDAVTFTGNGTDDVSARLKAAIDFVEQSGHSLYDFRNILMERYDEFRDGNDFVIPFDSLDEQLKSALMTIKTISEDTNNIYGVYRTTDTFAEKARTNGYDSLIIHDISEAFNQIGEEIKSTIAVIFDKSQLLSHIEIEPDKNPILSGATDTDFIIESEERVGNAAEEAAEKIVKMYRAFNSQHGVMGKGISWFSDDLETAGTYFKNVTFSGGRKDSLAQLETDTSKFMSVDANRSHWGEISYDGKIYTANELAELAKQAGYIGLEIRNVYDSVNGEGSKLMSNVYTIFDDNVVSKAKDQTTELEAELQNLDVINKRVNESLSMFNNRPRDVFESAEFGFQEIVDLYKSGSITIEQALSGIDKTRERILSKDNIENDFTNKVTDLWKSLKSESKYSDDIYMGFGKNDIWKSTLQGFLDGTIEEQKALQDLETEFRRVLELPNETPVSQGVTTLPSQIDSITESEQEAGQSGQQMCEQISDGMEKATASTNKYREALEKSFNTSGKKDTTSQLKQAYEEYQKYFGENGIEADKIVREQSDEGRLAAYNYAQALKEAINKGISETNLSKYRISDFNKYTTPDEIDDEFADARKYIQEQARILEELGNPNLSEDGIKALKEYMDQWDLLRNHKEGDFYIEDGILDEKLLQADINYLQALKESLEDIVKLSNESHDKTIASPESGTTVPAIEEQDKLQGEMEETGQAGQQAGEQAAEGMEALGNATKQTRQEQEKLSNSIDGISEPIDNAADSAEKLTQKKTETSSQTQGEDHLQQELGETSAAEDDASAAADKNTEALQRQQQAAEKAAESQDRLNNEINEDPSTAVINPEQIEALTKNLTDLLEEIQIISNAFKTIDDESGIPAIFKQIQDITTAINGLKDTLGSEDFAKNLSGGFPGLVEQIQQLVNVLNSGIDFDKLKGQVLSIPENEINKETTTLSSLESKIRDGIIKAIEDKNKAFTKEGKHVKTIVDEENGYLNSLQEKITVIANSLKNMLKEGVDENPFKDLFDSINESKDALKNFAEILAKSKADRKAAVEDSKKEAGKEASAQLKSIFKQTDIITPETEGWDLLVEKIRLAGVEMEDVVSIQRNLRKSGKELLESFQVTDVYGGKRTVGINTDGVITQNDVVWKDRSKDLDKLEANINKLSTAKTRKEFDDLSQKIQETIDDLTKLQESGNESIVFGDQLEILKNEFDSVSQSATKMFDTMDRDNTISSIRDQISSLSNVTTDEEFREAKKSIDSLIAGLQQYVDKGLLAQNAVDTLRDSFKLNTTAALANLDAIRQQENEAELAAARERALKEIGHGKADYAGIKAANKAVYDQYKKNVDEEAQIEQRAQSVRDENNKKNLAQYQEQLRIITEFKDQYKALMDQMINSVLSGNGLGNFVQDYKDLIAGFTGARNQVADMFANGQITASQGRQANLGFNEAYNAKNDIAKSFSGSTAIQDYIAKTQDSINKLSTTNSVDQINKLSSSIQVAIDNLSMLSKVIPGLDSSVDTLSDSFGNVTANIKVDQLKKLIKAYEDAVTKMNNLEAQRISGKETGEQQKEATKELNQAQVAAQDGLNKLKASTEDWNRLTIKQQQDLESMFNAASSGSAKSQDALQQAMDNAAKKGQNISTQQTNRKEKRDISVATKEIERYEKFVNKLEELSTRQSRGENVATQLNRQIQGLPDALSKAQTALASLQQMFQDGSQNIHIQDLLDLTNKIAEASNRANQISLEGFDNLDKGYNTLYNTAQKYYELLNKKSENKLTLNETEWLERYKKFLDEAIKKTGIFTNETDQQLNDLEQHLSDVFKNVTRNVLDENMIDISKMIDTAKDVDTKSVPSAYIQELNRLEQEYMQLDSTIKSVDWNGKSEQELTKLRDQFRESINNIKSGLDSLKGDQFKFMDQNYRSNMTKSIADWMSNNQKAKDAIAQIQPIFDRLSSSEALTKQQGEALVQTFKRISAEAAAAGKTGMSFAEKLRGSFGNLSRYLLSFASFYQVIGVFRQGITVVRELDTALTEMRKVSDETLSSLQRYQFDSFDIADQLGTTAKAIQDSTADWLRLGKSFSEAKEMAALSTKLLNVSEFENINDATQSLVSATQAYKDIDPNSIVDKLNLIGNNFAVSTDELAQGLQNAAAVLMTQGNSLDEALGLLTAGNLITQDMSKTSAGIRTISLRIAGLGRKPGNIEIYFIKTTISTKSIVEMPKSRKIILYNQNL